MTGYYSSNLQSRYLNWSGGAMNTATLSSQFSAYRSDFLSNRCRSFRCRTCCQSSESAAICVRVCARRLLYGPTWIKSISRRPCVLSCNALEVNTPCGSSNSNATGPVSIPATNVPYSDVQVRSCIPRGSRMNVRAIDVESRERSFCCLEPATVTGLLSRIPADRLSSITVTTAAVALNVFSNTRLPTLERMRLVSNTSETGWVAAFTREILNVMTMALERIEFSIEGNSRAVGWKTTTVLRILGSCLAAGCTLKKIVFLGLEPESRCVSLAATFAERHPAEPSGRALPSCPPLTQMTDSRQPLSTQQLADFDSVVLQLFQTVDDGSSWCVKLHGDRGSNSSRTQ